MSKRLELDWSNPEGVWLELSRAGLLPENVTPARLQAAHEEVVRQRERTEVEAWAREAAERWLGTGERPTEPDDESVELAVATDPAETNLSREVEATVAGWV